MIGRRTCRVFVRATSANSSPAKTFQSMLTDRFVLPGHGAIMTRERDECICICVCGCSLPDRSLGTSEIQLPVVSYASGAPVQSEPLTVLQSVFEAPLRKDLMHRCDTHMRVY
jgi:hypothetical protein